jgi:hypothetical protein
MNNLETPSAKITTVGPDDIALVAKELAGTPRPIALHALAESLAFQKTAGQRSQAVKKYDPYARYEVGDFIYKDYDETLTVGSKSVERFTGAVILKVVGKTYFKHFNCEMLEVDYSGGGPFRKYIDYMKKTKTQVLLPSNTEAKNLTPEIMDKGSDPRLTELPMLEKDLRSLEKSLRTEMAKSPLFFGWNDHWQLASKRIDIPDAKVKEFEADFETTRISASAEELVRKFYGLEASSDLFEIHCLSLSYVLDKKHKKEFVALAPAGWGRWHLKKILNGLPDGLPLAARMAKIPAIDELEKPEMSFVQDFPIKVYLTWREIMSGGIKIPRSLAKGLAHAREYMFTDPEEGKTYTLYYYPSAGYFLGLQSFYAANSIPQGTSLTLERKGPTQFHFWIKKSKKKLASFNMVYDAKEDKFSETPEETFTFAEPNKIIYLEKETVSALLPLYNERADLDLKELLILVFKNTTLSSPNHALHFLRAYHLVDVLRQTTQEDVEFTLLNSPEFSKSEKKKGIFFYKEPRLALEEIPEEIAVEAPAEEAGPAPGKARKEEYLPPGTVGFLEEEEEEPFPGGEPEIIDLTPRQPTRPVEVPEPSEAQAAPDLPPTPEKEKAKAAVAAKKEKPAKKKKVKLEGEKAARPKKSERRVIEEKLVEEESEMEALAGVKERDEEVEEQRARAAREKREKAEVAKPVSKDEPKFGIFGDLLKSALVKKKDEPKPEDEEDKTK